MMSWKMFSMSEFISIKCSDLSAFSEPKLQKHIKNIYTINVKTEAKKHFHKPEQDR